MNEKSITTNATGATLRAATIVLPVRRDAITRARDPGAGIAIRRLCQRRVRALAASPVRDYIHALADSSLLRASIDFCPGIRRGRITHGDTRAPRSPGNPVKYKYRARTLSSGGGTTDSVESVRPGVSKRPLDESIKRRVRRGRSETSGPRRRERDRGRFTTSVRMEDFLRERMGPTRPRPPRRNTRTFSRRSFHSASLANAPRLVI